MTKTLMAASLFSGAGIGDVGLRASGLDVVAMCEIEPDRSALSRLNFPKSLHFDGDVWTLKSSYCNAVKKLMTDSGEDDLFMLSCTAPCQGMSKSGQGTLLKNIREGKRPKLDPRNRLILPALDIIAELSPRWVVFENVIEMRSTLIEDRDGILRPVLDIIKAALGTNYDGDAYDVEFADYGIPQRRQRLVTVFTRDENAKLRFSQGQSFIPPRTHSATWSGRRRPWVSVSEALVRFHQLDGSNQATATSKSIPFHYVPVLDAKKYEWIRHTKQGASAFDNQCINEVCRFQDNSSHGNKYEDGINRASRTTPLYCQRCGSLLPRPYVEESDGTKRIMSGFTSAYKRMSAELPSPTLTRNLSYPCSDNKIHPFENRVLSLAEAMELQTISRYPYKWGPLQIGNKSWPIAPDSLIRLVIGESVPSAFFELLGKHLRMLSSTEELPHDAIYGAEAKQLSLL